MPSEDVLTTPLLAGPYLDRMSRKKVIYRLDYLSSTIYLALFFLLRSGWFHYPAMMGFCLLIGAINGVYTSSRPAGGCPPDLG